MPCWGGGTAGRLSSMTGAFLLWRIWDFDWGGKDRVLGLVTEVFPLRETEKVWGSHLASDWEWAGPSTVGLWLGTAHLGGWFRA